MAKRKTIRDLYCCAVGVDSRPFDFAGETYAEAWDYLAAVKCDCGKIVSGFHGEQRHCDVDEDTDCKEYISNEGPMMNYWWPLPGYDGDIQEDAAKLIDLPVCIVENLSNDVETSESYGLALTGGGMNLAWELAEAYMLLGYLPPYAILDLPQYCGQTMDSKRRWIVAGCKRSCGVMIDRGRQGLRGLRDLHKRMSADK